MAIRTLYVLLLFSLSPTSLAGATFMPSVGLNKFDLVKQYLGTASGGDGSDAYRRVTVAMARKAIADAADIRVSYLRVAAAGFSPNAPDQPSDLDLWMSDPVAHWERVDMMMDDLDRAGLRGIFTFAWNQLQFPALARETERDMIVNPRSSSARLFERYVTEFIQRYERRPTILLYEISNEINLGADLDRVKRCKKEGDLPRCRTTANYSTDEMIAYLARVADLIRKLDPSRPISAGHSMPRTNATYLRTFPEWTKRRPQMKLDSFDETARYLADVNDAADVISVHVYPEPGSRRFGISSSTRRNLIPALHRISTDLGKPLFIGEFGDLDKKLGVTGSYANEVLSDIVRLRVPFSALWVWELYDQKTFSTGDTKATRYSIDPSVDTATIVALKNANDALNPRQKPASKPHNTDRKRPHVVLTWPIPCAPVSSSTILHASAFDLSGSPKVRFLIDEQLISEDTTPPYSAKLKKLPPAKGVHIIRVEAIDPSGNVTAYEAPMISSPGDSCEPW